MADGYTRREIIRKGAEFAAIAVVAGPLVACGGSSSSTAETTLQRAQRTKTIRVGFANEAPFAYATPDGKLTGHAPEILRVAFANLGITQFDGVLTEFGSLIPSLVANRIDIIGAGMFIRPARCKQVSFANPEYQLGEGFAVKKGNPKNLKSYADVAKNPTAKMAVVTGGVEVEYAQVAGIPPDRALPFPDLPTSMAALSAGRVDVVDATTLSVHDLLKKTNDPNLQFQELSEQPKDHTGATAIGYGAMGFRKSDDDLRVAYNKELAKLKASGQLLQIMSPFGFSQSEIPPDSVTADQLCVG